MSEILGFVVLTGPLFLIVLWVPVCIVLAVWFGRKFIRKSLPLKVVVCTLVFLVAVVIPFSDEIAGRIYFHRLCDTEAGVKVYQPIELPAEYWDDQGNPIFYDESNGNSTLPSERFYEVESKKTNRLFGINEHRTILLDINTHKIISEKWLFRYWGGFISRNFTPHNTATHCGGDWDEFVKKQFVPVIEIE